MYTIPLKITDRPVITSLNPLSKRANPPVNGAVTFNVSYQLNPAVLSIGSGVTWTFRPSNATSILDDVTILTQTITAPYYFNVYFYSTYSYISFTSRAGLLYTGNYTCRIYNNLGSTDTVFQVLDTSKSYDQLILKEYPVAKIVKIQILENKIYYKIALIYKCTQNLFCAVCTSKN